MRPGAIGGVPSVGEESSVHRLKHVRTLLWVFKISKKSRVHLDKSEMHSNAVGQNSIDKNKRKFSDSRIVVVYSTKMLWGLSGAVYT